MIVPEHPSFARWYSESKEAPYLRAKKSPGGVLDLLEVTRPGCDMSRPALPDLVLTQDLLGGSRVRGNSGGGHFDIVSRKNSLYLSAPNFANTLSVDRNHQLRCLSLPIAQWQKQLDEATGGKVSFDNLQIYRGAFHSPIIQSSLMKLWALCDQEDGVVSRLLARAAGYEILAGLCRLSETPFTQTKGGLAPLAKRRVQECMRARLSEDISLDELAAEAQLSPFHFLRMFKQSVGVSPRAYLTQLRMERACELLEQTDLSIIDIAGEVGYSSSQVLARVFKKYKQISPTDYRQAVRVHNG
ncbi:helix-turn-helix domain-containing protein [Rheinheimera nanhaiensis]|uniref:Transcriptional regulatory protein n=1 Tax=Rheinheimera nanhaiensis E407-8 TaxID=562729 RepID=I1DVC2_9GAMM|nr:AraC family transcriptional regulator [Rheinheimera nanhaiensis]GAB58000.1 transcriptional regulatory protein [Rheinheimera nanhaiensis E407-8]